MNRIFNSKFALAGVLVWGALCVVGCGGSDDVADDAVLGTPADENPIGQADAPDAELAPPPPPPAAPMLSEEQPENDEGAAGEQDAPAYSTAEDKNGTRQEESVEAQRPGTDRVKAEAGVGKKGRGYGGGIVTEPIRAYFRTQQRLALQVEIPQAMNLYKAQHGRGPKSHEEFMNKIIEPNHIQLPELPEGHRYVYDPEREELMVERPAK